MAEGGFEQVLEFDGLLKMIFDHIYPLSLDEKPFSCGLVNKRWNRVWQHPLQTFVKGQFNSNLNAYPPSYYFDREPNKLYDQLDQQGGMTLQLQSIPEDDPAWEQFIKNEILIHYFEKSNSPYKNHSIQSLVNLLIPIGKSYYPSQLNPSSIKFLGPEPSVRWLLFNLSPLRPQLFISQTWAGDIDFLYLLSKYGYPALQYVPEDQKTDELCTEFLASNPRNLSAVPAKFLTLHNCTTAVMNASATDIFSIFSSIPPHLKSEHICDLAVSLDGECLSSVPDQLQTYQRCKTAVTSSASALDYVPQSLINSELCLIALEQNPTAIVYVPEHLKTPDICNIAINYTGSKSLLQLYQNNFGQKM
eukprot:TRINITY_DN1378_c0_g1_i1.p1 TRINITY_DN1378_c0_g1~~TRINITY_DN1378_c0_g1_i1.p1  ORF type:complete len:361 (+),score=59.80 TRINITY_DN1378_c0_g1_i1:85-1167(+)